MIPVASPEAKPVKTPAKKATKKPAVPEIIPARDAWLKRIDSMVDVFFDDVFAKLTPVDVERQVANIHTEINAAIVGNIDLVCRVNDGVDLPARMRVGVDEAGETIYKRKPYPQGRLLVVDWKTTSISTDDTFFLAEIAPQLVIYSWLYKEQMALKYYPGVVAIKLVYSTAKDMRHAKVMIPEIFVPSDADVDRARWIASDTIEMRQALAGAGLCAPRPAVGDFRCKGCAWQTACANWSREEFLELLNSDNAPSLTNESER